MYKLYFPLILFFNMHFSPANTLQTETQSDGSKIIFYPISVKPLSKKQLKKIEHRIDSYMSRLSLLFEKQPPQQNLSSLHKFKKYIDKIYKTNNIKYKISNTVLNSRILLLSQWLDSLPKPTSLLLQNCPQHIHRLTLKAHVLLQSKELTKWLDQMVRLVQKLCPKNNKKTPLTAKNKIIIERNRNGCT
ncbi:MAG: hypothetical protein OXM55_02570 [Bdellovibrionales bacterium]|nr:hypothetical protein [Bdellovibrionales bacterium]